MCFYSFRYHCLRIKQILFIIKTNIKIIHKFIVNIYFTEIYITKLIIESIKFFINYVHV